MTRPPDLRQLEASLDEAFLADVPRLRSRLRRLQREGGGDKALAQLARDIEVSRARVETRAGWAPRLDFPAILPVSARRDDIEAAIRDHQVVVVCGETGSGKTTQLPKICLGLGRGVRGMIGHTQPRRIAARAVARRVAEELGDELGAHVGFKIRFADRTGPDCRVKVMTDGILLSELQQDRWLNQYDTLIIDEAHERSLNIDFLLGYLRRVLERRRELKVIITSATIDPERFSRHFGDAPVVEVSGRTYPVEVRYRPRLDDGTGEQRPEPAAIVEAVAELDALPGTRGDVLVFLAGEREIREAADALRRHHPPGVEILPLYSRLSAADQDRVFKAHGRRRIVLATNIAETSLTVPGIRYVVDTGVARISRYSFRSKIQRLAVEPVSRASADQRKGRCGRERDGVCIRLYDEADFDARPEFTDPEILRTNLASVILQMASLRLGDVEDFPFVDPPDGRYVRDGYRLLTELGAVDESRRVTKLGRSLARLPVDPRLGRIILAGRERACVREMLVIASGLSVQDPREQPADALEAAREKHAGFRQPGSDFLDFLKLWDTYHDVRKHRSRNQQRRWCREHFLSVQRMREWHDVHQQLAGMVKDAGLRLNAEPADYETMHRALLTGFLGHVGMREEGREYRAARNTRFHLFPGSGQHARPPPWVVSAAIVETSRVYARTVARVEPRWIEDAAAHLVKRSYGDPHWQWNRGRVAAAEQVTLNGLVLAAGRRVDYGRIDPRGARDVLIREALVDGIHRLDAAFAQHNAKRMDEVTHLEARLRRRDLLASDQRLGAFYAERIPEDVCTLKAFDRWRRRAERGRPDLLRMQLDDVLATDVPRFEPGDFPLQLDVAGNALAVEYAYEVGAEHDGLTLVVPVELLSAVTDAQLDWLVPGLLLEKVTALIKALPKATRRRFVPAPDFARRSLEELEPGSGRLQPALARALQRISGAPLDPALWDGCALPDHLVFRVRVIDGDGTTLAAGRDLRALQAGLGVEGQPAAVSATSHWQGRGHTAWDFGPLPSRVDADTGGARRQLAPAIHDDGESVSLRLYASAPEAAAVTRRGLLRLFMLALPQQVRYLRREFAGHRELTLAGQGMGGEGDLADDLVSRAFEATFLDDGGAHLADSEAFARRLEQARGRLVPVAQDLAARVAEILSLRRSLGAQLDDGSAAGPRGETAGDIRAQLDHMVAPGFVQQTPVRWLEQMPRYLKAAGARWDRVREAPGSDAALAARVSPWQQRLDEAWAALGNDAVPDEVTAFRWMVEEYRVSVFAQRLGTSIKVSDVRLQKQWDAATRALRERAA